MAKLILEDLKFNKKKKISNPIKKNSLKEESLFVSEKEFPKNLKTEKKIEKIDKKEETEDEKIEKYLNKMHHRVNMGSFPYVVEEKSPVRKGLLYPFLIVFILGLVYLGGIIFERAIIHITQREETLNLDEKELIFSTTPSGIPFVIMITSMQEKQKVTLTGKENVSIKSKGEITLYNEFSTVPYKLQSGSFVVDENGKSYKTDTTVSIPGYKIVDGKKIIGEVSVPISAFLAGEEYNGSPNNFYISSFKNTDKYNKIYGKLKSPLVGGMAGEAYKLNDIDKDNIRVFANSSLKNNLIKKVKAETPAGYVFYENATNFSYNILGGDYFKNNNGEVIINGEMKVILIKEDDLKNKLVNIFSKDIEDKEAKNIEITNIKDLDFNFKNIDQVIDKDLNEVGFVLGGEANLLWSPDLEFLKSELLGVPKTEVNSIFKLDPGISHASIKIFPPWLKMLPKDISKIEVIID